MLPTKEYFLKCIFFIGACSPRQCTALHVLFVYFGVPMPDFTKQTKAEGIFNLPAGPVPCAPCVTILFLLAFIKQKADVQDLPFIDFSKAHVKLHNFQTFYVFA